MTKLSRQSASFLSGLFQGENHPHPTNSPNNASLQQEGTQHLYIDPVSLHLSPLSSSCSVICLRQSTEQETGPAWLRDIYRKYGSETSAQRPRMWFCQRACLTGEKPWVLPPAEQEIEHGGACLQAECSEGGCRRTRNSKSFWATQ